MARRVAIVPHTHWDREWYSSFPTFRLRLVDLLDEFLPLLEADAGYRHFLLDGQMAVVDDYLDVRPEAEPLLRRLAVAGRLAMGPWYILSDEFLVSGETLIRNLQLGLERAAAFGGAMEVGYLPDMFGHIAQMPQLLRQAGLEHTVVWRGVPSVVGRTAFWWEAPDGSTVRAEYLPAGYGNGAAIPDDAKALVRRIAAHDDELGDRLPPGAPMLWMNGTDHQVPQAWLGRVVAEANGLQDDYVLEVTSLADYLASAPTDGLDRVDGELRSGARANLLMGVGSNRVDVKQAAARAELALERLAEPLCALFMAPERWPQRLLDLAWIEVIRNSAHDSICACSIDDVCTAVLHRFAEARDTGIGLANRALKALAATVPDEGWVIVNPSSRTRGGIVELVIAGDETPPGCQTVAEMEGFSLDVSVTGAEVGTYLAMLRSQQLTDDVYVNAIDVVEHEGRVEVDLHLDSRMRDSLNVEEVKRNLYALAGARPNDVFTVKGHQPPARRVLSHVDSVDGYGWRVWHPHRLAVGGVDAKATDRGATMTNGLVTVEVDATTGSFALNGVAGLDRLVDDGDHGDTYNYSPPAHDTIVEVPDAVRLEIAAHGPVVGRVVIHRSYCWPTHIDPDDGGRRVGEVDTVVRTTLEVHAGEPFVRVETRLDNLSRDHRLRTWFPLAEPATTSRAECAFALVERGLEAEGGPTERGLPTYPSRRWVQAGALTVAHEGLLEYELVDEGRALALTLLRCTGMLSRTDMAYRPLPAGPDMIMDGPQMQGRQTLRYAVAVGEVDPWAMAEDAFVFLSPVAAPGGGTGPVSGSALDVSGAQVSSLRRRSGRLELRVFNPTDDEAEVTVAGRRGWLIDLRDRPLASFEQTFTLGPWQIATARLDD